MQFFVVTTRSSPIIGLKACEKLNLIKRIYQLNKNYDELLQRYDSTFGDLGCLPGEYHINIDPNAKPVVHPARRVPFALKAKLKAELQRMVSLDVIAKVDKPTGWVNSIVVVEKSNGDIRPKERGVQPVHRFGAHEAPGGLKLKQVKSFLRSTMTQGRH